MNPTRLLGAVALATGGSLLLSELFLGPDLLTEVTGIQLLPLRLVCAVAIVVGGLAVGLGMREEREFHRHRGGKDG